MTNKERFKDKVKRMEKLMEIELTINIWQDHFSVYTVKDKCDHEVLVQARTAGEALAQVSAIINALHVMKELRNENT